MAERSDISGEFGTWLIQKRNGTFGEGSHRKSLWRCICTKCTFETDITRGRLLDPDVVRKEPCPKCAIGDTSIIPEITTFTKNQIDSLTGPIVYFLLNDTECLYIGSSGTGLSRVFSSTHAHIQVLRKECTRVSLVRCPTTEFARNLERVLIGKMSPRLNVMKPGGMLRQGS